MKKILKITSVIVVLSIILSVAAFAVETRSSDYFSSYKASIAKLSNGNTKINFKVIAKSTMTMLGVSVIKLYDANDNYIATLTYTDYPEMMASNDISHENSVTYSGGGNVSYAVVTFFAKNSSGYEYAYYTT